MASGGGGGPYIPPSELSSSNGLGGVASTTESLAPATTVDPEYCERASAQRLLGDGRGVVSRGRGHPQVVDAPMLYAGEVSVGGRPSSGLSGCG